MSLLNVVQFFENDIDISAS